MHNEWAKMIYDRNDEFLNDNLLKYIEYHLGYRFVFRDIKLYDEVSKGNKLDIGVKIENVGFGNILKKKNAFIYLLDNNGNVVYKNGINNDIMDYKSGTVSNDKISIDIPNDFNPGTYMWQVDLMDQLDLLIQIYGMILLKLIILVHLM